MLHQCGMTKCFIHLLEIAVYCCKATAPLVHISDNSPQTKGETSSPHFCSLVCSYCPVCKKIKLQSLRYIHHFTFLARVGSVRRVCGDLEEFFWSSAYSVLKRHQEKLHWFFSLLASPKFLYRELAGGPPCRCCFNSATQNGVGQNRLLQQRGRGTSPKSLQQLFLTLSWDFQSRTTLLCLWEFGLCFSLRPCQHFSANTDLEV